MNDFGPYSRILVRHARDAFVDQATVAREWQSLNFTAPPDFAKAIDEYDRFVELLRTSGADIEFSHQAPGTEHEAPSTEHPAPSTQHEARSLSLDSIYVRDASVMCSRGAILCRMGKPQRADEPRAQAEVFGALGIPVAGAIAAPGQLEGGDVCWLDARTVAVGRGYRTNDDGIRQLRAILGGSIDSLIIVALPHYRGPSDVFHLMSILSPVDRDLAVVYSSLMPVPFREQLLDRGFSLVEVPDDEFESMGTNVLGIGPRRAVMVAGNPKTRMALERAGAEVLCYEGGEISLKGGGGPTCLTRPIFGNFPECNRAS